MNKFEEIEAIKQLKYRYFRFLDMKRFKDLAELFTTDGTTAYDNGRYSFKGHDEIYTFMDESMGRPEAYTSHQGHHPEITLADEKHATGIWHFEDTVHMMDYKVRVCGAGVYWDEYLKVDGQWKFQHSGYERLWVRSESLAEDSSREIRGMYDKEERLMSAARPMRQGEDLLFPSKLMK